MGCGATVRDIGEYNESSVCKIRFFYVTTINSSLGQQITVVDKPKDTFPSVAGKEVQLVVITSKYDSKYKKLDNPNGHIETSRGVVAADGKVHSNFGVIDPKSGKMEYVDPKTGKQELKQAVADPLVYSFLK